MVVMMGLGTVTEKVLRPPPRKRLVAKRVDHQSALDGVVAVSKSQYLLLLVGLVIFYELATTFSDFAVNVVFEQQHLGEDELARMYGRLGWMAGGVAIVAQLVLVPMLLPTKRKALLLPPFVLLATCLGFVALPMLATALLVGSVDRGLNYSVHQSTRESLYVPLSDEQRYKAKAFIDMFVDRAAKAGASVLLLGIIVFAGSSPRVTLLASCGAMVAWIGSAKKLGTYADARYAAPRPKP